MILIFIPTKLTVLENSKSIRDDYGPPRKRDGSGSEVEIKTEISGSNE